MRQFIKAKAQFGNTTFYRIKTGQIVSKGGNIDHLHGILTRVNILQDEGNPEFKVKPHEVIEFTLEQEEGTAVVQVSCTSSIAATYVAQALNAIKSSQLIAFTTSLGNQKVTFVNFFVEDLEADDWAGLKFNRTEEDFESQLKLELKNLRKHKLFGEFKPASVTPRASLESAPDNAKKNTETEASKTAELDLDLDITW